MSVPADVAGHWDELVTTALLGTDRRDPPDVPPGPLADLVADTVRNAPSARLLAEVAACAAVRRAAFVPDPPADLLVPPAIDLRPVCSPAATATWRYLSAQWPVLEDEWVLEVIRRDRRLPADVMVALLRTHRRDPIRRARVVRAAGPVGAWLLDHVPELQPVAAPRRRSTEPSIDDQIASLPELAIPPDLMGLLSADAHSFVRRLLPDFHEGRVGSAHRAVIVHLLARCRAEVLLPVAEALAAVDVGSPSSTIAHVLADLARTRARMLDELA